jgi:hypothetical protein
MSALKRTEDEYVQLRSGDDIEAYRYALAGHGPQHETIIEVDRDDDLTSVRSKLESTRLPRAVIIILPKSKTLREGLEFRVLRRLQRELGLDMVIVSSDLNKRGLARENGFHHVFHSLKAYYTSKDSGVDRIDGTPFTDPSEFTPSVGIGRWGIAIAAALAAVVAVIVYVALPVETVTVYPQSQLLTRDVQVQVETGGPKIDVTAQRLTGRVLEQRVQVQGSISVASVPGAQPPPNQPVTITLQVRDALHSKMMQQAATQLNQQLKAEMTSTESLPQQSVRTEVIGERYDHSVGDNAAELSGYLEVAATGLAFSNDDFNALVYSLWSQDIPKNYGAVSSPELSPPTVVSSEGQHMTLQTKASGRVQGEINADAINNAARWQTLDEARNAVAKLGSFTRPPEVALWPEWASRASRIQVKSAVDPAVAQRQPPPAAN